MAIVDRHVDSAGLGPSAHNIIIADVLGSHKASNTNNVLTTNSLATAFNNTVAVGTNIDFPRNLTYVISMSGGSASSAGISQGTIAMVGLDIRNSAISETIGMQALAAAGTSGIGGTAIFASINSNGLSFSSYLLHTSYSLTSNSVTIGIGVGNIVGLLNNVRSTNAIPQAFIGTLNQVGSYTVQPGPIGTAGISFSNALATGTPVNVYRIMSR